MKVTKFKEELKQLSPEQLREKAEQLKQKLFSLRLSAQTSHVKNYAEFKQLRRDIARVLTFIDQKELGIQETK